MAAAGGYYPAVGNQNDTEVGASRTVCVDDLKWYCLRSKVKREITVAQVLNDNLGVEVFCPRIRIRKMTKRGLVWFEEAMFPGYFFARFDLVKQLKSVSYSCGVTGLVHFGDVFAEVPPAAISELRDQLGEECLLVVEGSCSEGDEVEVVDGPFKGLVGMVVDRISGKERVRILIDFLGRSLDVELNEKILLRHPKG